MMRTLLLVAALAALAVADHYGHSGCVVFHNNKVNEDGDAAENQNRLFNSQNNAEAGYKWTPNANIAVGSQLQISWTQQHACGKNPKMWCEEVLQYMCTSDNAGLRDADATQGAAARQTIDENDPDNQTRGQNEAVANFQDCNARERNKGLFNADQNVGNNNAQETRQNPGGTEYGFECQEERDYYPYWHPSPWRDIAVLTSNTSRCELYLAESQNVKDVNYCTNAAENNEGDCGAANWQTKAAKGLAAPECDEAPWSRDNMNGPTSFGKYNGYAGERTQYNWTAPAAILNEDCVFRIRYNMSSGDYDNWNTDASSNGNGEVENDPTVELGMDPNDLQLSINTNQISRTFQDRTELFRGIAKPGSVEDGEEMRNLCSRGGRGNIVEKYPMAEYDFHPKQSRFPKGTHVHIQMTGTDYENANNGGQGQANQNRSNICASMDNNAGHHLPAHLDDQYMFEDRNTAQDACDVGGTGGTLDAAPAYYDVGHVQFTEEKDAAFISTRNNQYTNRSQKGKVKNNTSALGLGALLAIVIASVMLLAGAVGLGVVMYARANPHSKVGAMLARRSLLGSKSSGHSGYQSGGSYGSYQRRSYQSKGSKGSRR